MTLLRDLIDIDDQSAGRFVLKLSSGVKSPENTLGNYVVTPELAAHFDRALKLIQEAVRDGVSAGAYLHGSFGAGKSHFMAVLNFILAGNQLARNIPELAPVIATHNAWISGKKFLMVPYHMIGKQSLEDAVLRGYRDFIRESHPDVPLPPVYRADALIDQARIDRRNFGDAQFFEVFNRSARAVPGLGALAQAWTPQSFDRAATALNAADNFALMMRLSEYYGAKSTTQDLVNIDDGLSILSRHAHQLGYSGLVLFLDEMWLWLNAHKANHHFLGLETSKLVTLVEAQNAVRPVPIISFLARQRPLKDLIGEGVLGATQAGYDNLAHWNEDRFSVIELSDRNLPVIVEKRVLKPKSDAAKATIDAAFQAFQNNLAVRQSIMDTLLTHKGDRDMFRKVYPFSPALIQALVALSSVLQQERTALKVLMQLLVDHRDTLAINDLVPIGDLFDVLIHGDAVDDPDVITHFKNAEKLYHKVRQRLERDHGVTRDDVRQRPAADPVRREFEADDRLVKTLLLAALVPDVEALRGLTAERLAALNHGTIASPIAGREAQIVAEKVASWAGEFGEFVLSGNAANPVISIQLADVDIEGILQQVMGEDNYANRLKIVRELVYKQVLGREEVSAEFEQEHAVLWRGIARDLQLVYRNVREMSDDQLSNPDAGWKLVIDFPFDSQNQSPRDDLTRLDQYRQTKGATKTIAWVPAFLSQTSLESLGRLVKIEHVLSGSRFDQYAATLPPIARPVAHDMLTRQRDTLRGQMVAVLHAAYGINSTAALSAIDDSHDHEEADRFQSLSTGLVLQPPAATDFATAIAGLVGQALAWEFPAAPAFEKKWNRNLPGRVLTTALEASKARDGRAAVPEADRNDIRLLANPLKIGDMPRDGTHFVIGQHWVNHFAQKRGQDSGPLTVEKLRRWIDEPQRMGLPSDLQNLVILVYASQTGMSFRIHGGPVDGTPARLDDAWELYQETPPDPQQWITAVQRAASIFGVASSQLGTAANAVELGTKVKAVAQPAVQSVRRYSQLLRQRLASVGVAEATADRLKTADATVTLLDQVGVAQPRDVVTTLASAAVPTTEQALGDCVKTAGAWCSNLEDRVWTLVNQVQQGAADLQQRATPILDDLRKSLKNEHHTIATPLKDVLDSAYDRLMGVLFPPRPPEPPQPPEPPRPPIDPPVTPPPAVPPAGSVENLAPDDAMRQIDRIRLARPSARVDVRWSEGSAG